jgi:hypothetical protein
MGLLYVEAGTGRQPSYKKYKPGQMVWIDCEHKTPARVIKINAYEAKVRITKQGRGFYQGDIIWTLTNQLTPRKRG